MAILVRQEKDKPNNWHIAAQGSEDFVKNAALQIGRRENDSFVKDKDSGDVKGNNTILLVFEKTEDLVVKK